MEEGEYWPDYERDRSLPEASLDYAELEAMMENGSLANFTQGHHIVRHVLTAPDLAMLTVATVANGVNAGLTLWVASHARAHVLGARGVTDPDEDSPDHTRRFTRFALFTLATILAANGVDWLVHYDYYFTWLIDWDRWTIQAGLFVEFIRLCRESVVLALAINQIISLASKGSVIRPWKNVLTWVLMISNTLCLPSVILWVRLRQKVFTINQTIDLVLGPSLCGIVVFVVLYVMASEQVKKGQLSQSATNATKISLGFVSIMLIRCAATVVLDVLLWNALHQHWYLVLQMLALPTLLMYPLCFMLFRTRPRITRRLFTCLNLHDTHSASIAERRQVVRMSESNDAGVFDLLSIGGAAQPTPAGQ